jgi:phosphoribosyl 1,2-cyclic phosphodiesterase
LVDVGLSRKEIAARLSLIGESVEALDAVLITHEHSDHVCGLATLAKKDRTPVFMTRLTASSIAWHDCEPRLDSFQSGASFHIGDIDVQSFTVPHDAIDPVGFTLRAQGVKIAVVTDLGYITDSIRYHLRDTNLLLLECNHDVEMLKVGPYPWCVKQRVMGRKGHLSNDVACEFLRRDLDGAADTVVLGHLSEHNNHPARVRLEAGRALAPRALFRPRLVVAEPRRQSEVFSYG